MTEHDTPTMTRRELVDRLVAVMQDGAKAGLTDTLGAAWCAMQIVGGPYAAETVARYCSLTAERS